MKKYSTIHICRDCGRTFYTQHKTNSTYCSKECKNWYLSKLNKERNKNKPKKLRVRLWKPQERKCKYCDDKFIQKEKHQIYCSEECGKKYQKEKYYLNTMGLGFGENNNFPTYLKLRFEIFKRDMFRCQYCGRNPRDNKTILNIDHIIPKSKGGITDHNNLITSCKECNAGKKDVLLEERKLINEVKKDV